MKKTTLEKIILEMTEAKIKTRADLDSFKRKMAKKYKIACPSNLELLSVYHKLVKKRSIRENKNIEKLLRIRPVRSLSGIVNVSALTKPYACPGKCIYCPTEKGIPKSYVSGEPAVERAKMLKYSPYLQVKKRLEALASAGHPTDKIELRIIGGTWSYYPRQYQTWFVKQCLQACNTYNKTDTPQRCDLCINHTSGVCQLYKLQKRNEKAKCRIVGITVETRPDFIDIKEIKRMRGLGITRVELGVQTLYDDVLKLNKRGHKKAATIRATKLLKDAGFKVSYQMMPNLPGSNFKRDIKMFEQLFSKSDFQPDLLKIYPLALVKNSLLYHWYRRGKYKPYSERRLVKLLIEIKKRIPYYCRIQRIIRDIPSEDIVQGGAKISNLREVVQKEMAEQGLGLRCKCIRCREIKDAYEPKAKLYLLRQDYEASGGKEIFLSFENKTRSKLYALLRLRLVSDTCLTPLKNAAIIREVHTYGQMVPISGVRDSVISAQHKGLGKKLIKQAEKIAKHEFSLKKIAVIASIGTRPYYYQLGYRLKNTYMVKSI